MSNPQLNAALEKLAPRDLDFVRTYLSFAKEHPRPSDATLANALGCTRRTILNRRRRIQAAGVPIYRLADRGYQPNRHQSHLRTLPGYRFDDLTTWPSSALEYRRERWTSLRSFLRVEYGEWTTAATNASDPAEARRARRQGRRVYLMAREVHERLLAVKAEMQRRAGR